MALTTSLLGYLVVVIALGLRGRVKQEGAFYDGGHKLSAAVIFIMVTALWGSSIIAVEIDTAYRYGISAAWFGVSVALMSVLVSLLVPVFRRMDYVSNSAWLGHRFGNQVRRITGFVIGTTFPIFALSNSLVAAYFLHVAMAWPLWFSLAMITGVMVVYVQFGGIVSLAYTQGFNLVVMLAGLALMGWHVMQYRGMFHPVQASFWHPAGIGFGMILVWFGMNTLNVLSAQAEFQAVAAAKNGRQAQWAVWLSSLVLVGIIIVSTGIGIMVRLDYGQATSGLQAFSMIMTHQMPTWMKIGIALGIWALALTWCGPLLFSGATSLGRDVLAKKKMVKATRWALIIEGALMVAYGVWRPGEIAWWRVFGLTLRNASVVGPTLAALLWPDLSPRVVLAAMGAGIASGLGLNAATGFSAVHFIGHINPMWVSAAVGFAVLAWGRISTKGSVFHYSALLGLGGAYTVIWRLNGGIIPVAWTGPLLVMVSVLAMAGAHWITRGANGWLDIEPLME